MESDCPIVETIFVFFESPSSTNDFCNGKITKVFSSIDFTESVSRSLSKIKSCASVIVYKIS